MRKSRKIQRRKAQVKPAPSPQATRRDFLKILRNGGVGGVVIAGGGYFAFGSFTAYAAEHDLSRIGQGKPVVVQVHDPQCPVCTSLQKQTRRALREFGECDFVYLVADIKTPEGQAFAALHRVPHVTLLVFDAVGTRLETVSGMQSAGQLIPIFKAHHRKAVSS